MAGGWCRRISNCPRSTASSAKGRRCSVGWPRRWIDTANRISRQVTPQTGTRALDILHVAQSQYHDIAVARRLGYHTCWIERRKGKQGAGATPTVQNVAIPDYHFGSLVELADAVDAGK